MRVAAIHFSYYPQDVRPRREGEALVEAGASVDTICLRRDDEPLREIVNGVNVHRIPMKKKRSGKISYFLQYFSFLFLAFAKLSMLHFRERFDVVHIHNMPDVLVFAALVPKLGGSRVILDIHDPMPELYMTKYSIKEDHYAIRLLKLLEKWSIRFADHVITPNISFRNLFISRSCPEEKISIVMNSPMETVFRRDENVFHTVEEAAPERLVLMYHGTVFERHGLDTAVEALALLRGRIPDPEFRVFGEGEYTDRFLELVAAHGMQGIVKYFGAVSLEEISRQIQLIDIGIIPNKKSPFTDINLPVRIFEYLCMGKPTVAPRTRGVLDYFDDDSLFLFEPGNPESLAEVILRIHSDPVRTKEVTERGINVYWKYRWEVQKQDMVRLVNGLTGV